MATYKGLIQIRGSLGDLVFYELNGKPVVRRKSGFNSLSFAENPNYENVRKNSTEFGHCSRTGKLIRSALAPFTTKIADKYLYQRFNKLMTQIKDLDTTNPKGKRKVQLGLQTESGQKLLSDFKFGHMPTVNSFLKIRKDLFSVKIILQGNTGADFLQLIQIDLQETEAFTQVFEFDIPAPDADFDLAIPPTVGTELLFAILRKRDCLTAAGFLF